MIGLPAGTRVWLTAARATDISSWMTQCVLPPAVDL